jgi:hypothetical protein
MFTGRIYTSSRKPKITNYPLLKLLSTDYLRKDKRRDRSDRKTRKKTWETTG